MKALDKLAERIVGMSRNGAHVERFKVVQADPLVIEQVDGDLILEDGDPDFEVSDRVAGTALAPGDAVYVFCGTDGEWIAIGTASEGGDGGGGGGGAPSGPAGGVLAGEYPDPDFAVDMATQAELDAEVAARVAALADHVAAADPHPGYALDTDLALYVPKALVDAKGDLLIGTADNVVGRMAATGVAGNALVEDPTTATGWKSAPVAPGGAAGGDLANNYPNPTVRQTSMPDGFKARWYVDSTLAVKFGEVWSRLAFEEDFSVNPLGNYTKLPGYDVATWDAINHVVEGGGALPAPNGSSAYYRTDGLVLDADYTMDVNATASTNEQGHVMFWDPVTGWYVTIGPLIHLSSGNRYIDVNVFDAANVQQASDALGVNTFAIDASGGRHMWIRVTKTGNNIRCRAWQDNPALGGPPIADQTYTLLGTAAANLGTGRQTRPGWVIGNNQRLYGFGESFAAMGASPTLRAALISSDGTRVERAIMRFDGTTDLLPKIGSITSAMIADGTITDTDVAAANKDGAAGTPSMRTIGGGALQVVAGNDARLTNTRTPTDATVTPNKIAVSSGAQGVNKMLALAADLSFVWIDPPPGVGGYTTIKDEGVSLTQRGTVDFVGAGVVVTDDAPNAKTIVTIAGGSSSAARMPWIDEFDGTKDFASEYTVSAGSFSVSSNRLVPGAANSRVRTKNLYLTRATLQAKVNLVSLQNIDFYFAFPETLSWIRAVWQASDGNLVLRAILPPSASSTVLASSGAGTKPQVGDNWIRMVFDSANGGILSATCYTSDPDVSPRPASVRGASAALGSTWEPFLYAPVEVEWLAPTADARLDYLRVF